MIKMLISPAIILMVIIDIIAIAHHWFQNRHLKQWIIVSIVSSAILSILFIITIEFNLKELNAIDYLLALGYSMLFVYRCGMLFDLKDRSTDTGDVLYVEENEVEGVVNYIDTQTDILSESEVVDGEETLALVTSEGSDNEIAKSKTENKTKHDADI